jgi:hypothetical protein
MKQSCSKVKREEKEKISVSSHVVSSKLLKKEQLSLPHHSVNQATETRKTGCFDSGFDSSSLLCSCCLLLEKNNPNICR